MISALTRRAKETASLNALRWNNKMNKEPGCGMMSRHGLAFIRIVLLFHLSVFSEAVSLAHLVKAEIVSPYFGILVNTSVGNPTTQLIASLGR